jgi:hypothetical protein
MDVAGFSWDTNSKCQLDSREVINVDGGRTSLREANGSEVVSEAESKADGRGEAVIFRGAWVNGWLVLRIRLAKKWCGFGADGEVDAGGAGTIILVGKCSIDVAAEDGALFGEESRCSIWIGFQVAEDTDRLAEVVKGG